MKKITLILLMAGISLMGYAQTTPKTDTTKIWTIHGENTFLINQSSFSNWASGGVNSVAGNILLNYDFNYKKAVWSWDNKVILGYGLSKQQGIGTRKNDDRIILNSLLGRQASKYWMYTFYMNFQSQFAKGYKYDGTNQTLISSAFAPAYLTFGPGFAINVQIISELIFRLRLHVLLLFRMTVFLTRVLLVLILTKKASFNLAPH